MSKANSTPAPSAGKTQKPNKPYPGFPLFPHAGRVGAKEFREKMHYFGTWDDPNGALKKYLAEKDALHAARKPREDRRADGEGAVQPVLEREAGTGRFQRTGAPPE